MFRRRRSTTGTSHSSPREVAPPGVDRYQFAKDAVTATQSTTPRHRGPLGTRRGRCDALHLPHIHALVHRIPVEPAAPQRALALAVLFVFAGMPGMPGADDMDDIIDTIGQN